MNFLIVKPVINLFKLFVAKYTEENLQKILKTVLKARAPAFDKPCKMLLKAKSSYMYCNKSYMES